MKLEIKSASGPIRVFAVLAAYLVLVKLVITFQPELFKSASQAAVFRWPFLALWIVLGLAGVLIAGPTGFPDPLRAGSRWKVVLWPLVFGVLLGALAILTDHVTGWTGIVAAEMNIDTIHIDFPASLFTYPGGAIIVNILYRIFPIPLLLWLISTVLLHGRAQGKVFWVLAVLLSLVEPMGDLGLAKHGVGMMVAVFSQDYALNLLEAHFFRKLGFLAPILLRVFFYLIWHVLWGAIQ